MAATGQLNGSQPRIVILGAGCTGLGAAYRLHELGCEDFVVLEASPHPGGLSSSFVDAHGFTWDLGGHVLFSHYAYFDNLLERALAGAWLQHVRESYIWLRGTLIPYPFQNNLRHLAPHDISACLKGLIRAQSAGDHASCDTFHDWILRRFGAGIAEIFLFPYNRKVWAHPLEQMSHQWIGERVATVDYERALDNVILARDDPGWGPNSTFLFPIRGGTGAIWKAVAALIPERHLRYDSIVTEIDASHHRLGTAAGGEYEYDVLISTIPIDVTAGLLRNQRLTREASGLRYTTTHIVGVGLSGQPGPDLATKNWLYFPGADSPYYRVTVFSNYSPNNTPDADHCWSLMAEVSESRVKPVHPQTLVSDVIRAMLATNLIRAEDDIVSVWQQRLERGYPVPTVGRDDHIRALFEDLESNSIYSRGRFGAWKYEVGNQDHSCMQGVELVDRLLLGIPERTISSPAAVNSGIEKPAAMFAGAAAQASKVIG